MTTMCEANDSLLGFIVLIGAMSFVAIVAFVTSNDASDSHSSDTRDFDYDEYRKKYREAIRRSMAPMPPVPPALYYSDPAAVVHHENLRRIKVEEQLEWDIERIKMLDAEHRWSQ